MQRRAYRQIFTKEAKPVEVLIQNTDEKGDILAWFDTLTITFEKCRSLDRLT